MQKDERADMAAVAVTRSRLISFTQREYSTLVEHVTSTVSLQTQVPPESATTEALTAMM